MGNLFVLLFRKVRHRKTKLIGSNFCAVTEPWFPNCWSRVLSVHYSAFHNLQQFSLPLCLLPNAVIHQIQPPPFLCPLNLLPALAMPILLWVIVTAFWLALLPPSSLAVQVIFHGFASTVSLITLQQLPTHSNENPDFGQWLHSTSPARSTQPFLFALVSHYNPAHIFNFSLFVATPPSSELLGQLLCVWNSPLLLFLLD